MQMHKFYATAAVVLAGAGAMAPTAHAQSQNVAEVAMSNPNFSTLVTAVKAAGLANALKNTRNITVFAPTNAAFAKVPKSVLANLLKPENKATLVKVLTYHVVPMRVSAKKALSLPSGTGVKTLSGEKFAVRSSGGKVMVDAFGGGMANVTKADIKARNGIIHVIDTVIIPPSVVRAMAGG